MNGNSKLCIWGNVGLALFFAMLLGVELVVVRQAEGAGDWTNEPEGSTVLIDCGFDTPTCGGRLFDPYGTVQWTLSVQQDNTAPFSPSSVLRSTMDYKQRVGGTQLSISSQSDLKEIYAGFWWRTNPEFSGNAVGNNKTFFIRGRSHQNGVFMWKKPQGTSESRLFWTTQLPYNLNQCGGADIDQCFANVKDVPLVPGTWYKIETYFKASSCPTCRDGVVRWWINGQLAGNYLNFAYGPDVSEWVWSETWDGFTNGNGFTSNPSHFIDHLHISMPKGGAGTDSPPGAPAAPTIRNVLVP